MNYPDDIDIFYFVGHHGWSTCYIYVHGEMYQMGLTHVLEDPIEVLLRGLTLMLQGENETEFRWHDEPGEYKWHIQRHLEQRHKVEISITGCTRIGRNWPKLETVTFEVKLRLFCLCVLKQMEKIRGLLAEESFAKYRDGFPHQAFNDFQLAYEKSALKGTS